MRIWLIGVAQKGTDALRQLQKNPAIEVVVSDASPNPLAIQQGVIEKVDYTEAVTQLNINTLARRIRPDLILIDTGAEGRTLGRVVGGQAFTQALNYEMASASEYPCLLL